MLPCISFSLQYIIVAAWLVFRTEHVVYHVYDYSTFAIENKQFSSTERSGICSISHFLWINKLKPYLPSLLKYLFCCHFKNRNLIAAMQSGKTWIMSLIEEKCLTCNERGVQKNKNKIKKPIPISVLCHCKANITIATTST